MCVRESATTTRFGTRNIFDRNYSSGVVKIFEQPNDSRAGEKKLRFLREHKMCLTFKRIRLLLIIKVWVSHEERAAINGVLI